MNSPVKINFAKVQLITETPYLPFSWLLLFLAALAVTIGHLVYQTLSPQLVQQKSEDDLINAANELNRSDNGISPERLRQALDHLRTGAELLPHKRNRWLVTRNRRTVWLPDDLELYDTVQVTDTEAKPPEGIDSLVFQPPAIDATDQEVSAEDRKRITIEEGERARYQIEVYRLRPAAWLSGGFYFLGGWYLFIIVVMQLANIADTAGMVSLRQYIFPYRQSVAWWGTGVLLVLITVGIFLAWDGLWEKHEGNVQSLVAAKAKRDKRDPGSSTRS